ncbi:MAG: MGMT family protein [bacterium]|nr:MGMT family protein [bacterium]
MKPNTPNRTHSDFYQRVYDLVRQIPYGHVTNYGHVARLLGSPGAARTVGYALHSLTEGTDVPWQRVVNRSGKLSLRKLGEAGEIQRRLLEAEGIEFSTDEKIDFERFGWWGEL